MSEQNTIPPRVKIITLDFPYTTPGGKKIEKVTLRSPTVRDRLLRSRDPALKAEADINMMARLCGLELDDILLMEIADYLRVEEVFNFLALPTDPKLKEKSTSA